MRTYHPRSWSRQARELSWREIHSVNGGYCTLNEAINFFSKSYRAPIIRYRAAKHFGRKVRENRVKERRA